MNKPVKWGILGAAQFALKQMGPAIHAAKDAELAALATRSEDKAAAFQAFAPGLTLYQSYDALLADPEIEAVYIPLPNTLHVEWTMAALRAGKHVLCEKPIALQASEIDPVIALRDETGLLAAEAFMIVHHPQWIRAKELVRTGAIGSLLHVDAVFSYDNRADRDNIRNKPDTGGGSLPDIGVYTIGAARFVSDQEPVSVAADIRWERGVDVTARVDAAFETFTFNGLTSMRLFPRQEVTLHGDAGLVRVRTPFNAGVYDQAEIALHQPGLSIRTERFPSVNQYVLQVEAFGASLRGKAPYPCPLEFSRGTQVVIDRAFASAGRP